MPDDNPRTPGARPEAGRRLGALVLTAWGLALLDAGSTWLLIGGGTCREANPAVARLIDAQPLWAFPCVAMLVGPLPLLPELPRLTVAAGLVTGHGMAAINNLSLLFFGRSCLSAALPFWVFVAAPSAVAFGTLVVLKLTVRRGEPMARAALWLTGCALYVAALGAGFWLLGECLPAGGG